MIDLGSFSGGGCPQQATIQDLESLGRSPGRWPIDDASIPSSKIGVYFGCLQSHRYGVPLELGGG